MPMIIRYTGAVITPGNCRPPVRRAPRRHELQSISRRAALLGIASLPFGLVSLRSGSASEIEDRLRQIEQASGGRLGVAMRDLEAGRTVGRRADERFPMCSTFKLLAVAAVLARVDRGTEELDRRIQFRKADLLEYAPVTAARVSEGSMPVAELCEAAITVSDNTAANLLLATLGGPAGVTSYARSLGDTRTRLDRIEPALNEALPEDPRDTTTPRAMLEDLERLILRDALSARSRETLTTWLVANKTGDARIRAAVPAGWRVGDKTGTGANGTANDVGIVWPPGRAPLLLAVYLTASRAAPAARERAIADVARAVISW